jgi:signal transduction histidine kinase
VGAYEQSMVFACDGEGRDDLSLKSLFKGILWRISCLLPELEGPLQAITLSAIAQQDLEAVNAFDAVANNVEILSLSAVRMASRLKVLRAVAQETAGHLQFETIEFDVRRFVEELAKMHRSFASVPIRWRVDPLVPDRIVSAQVGIEQILANGLTNSCKFCTDEESGTIRIEVSVRPESSVRCDLCFAVVAFPCVCIAGLLAVDSACRD